MTGRELIIYILENHLENISINDEHFFIGFISEAKLAESFDVGIDTIRAWVKTGVLDGIEVNGRFYFLENTIKEKKDE